ncbi:glycosyltransferase [Vibrio metschnikovii]|uniref:glycosyltransferase n=1 Tax=Vibrio metschnikovii TaxID=28172 RepID=UPI003751E53C
MNFLSKSYLKEANELFNVGEYEKAFRYYKDLQIKNKDLSSVVEFNIKLLARRMLANSGGELDVFPWFGNSSIIIYTCNFGGYESVKEPESIIPGVKYILFTDDPSLKSKHWDVHVIDTKSLSSSRASRLPKILPHQYLPEHDISIYVDSSITLKNKDLNQEVISVLGDNHFAFYPHFSRDCIYEEAEACISLGKVRKDPTRRFIKKIKQDGFPKQFGLVENALIVRKNTILTQRVNEFWYDLYYQNQPRDQFYLMYVLWRLDAPFSLFKDSDDFRKSPWLSFTSHRHQDRKSKFETYSPSEILSSNDFLSNDLIKKENALKSIIEHRVSGSILDKVYYSGKSRKYYTESLRLISEIETFGFESAHHFRRILASKLLYGKDAVIEKSVNAQVNKKIGYIPSSPMPTAAANNVHVMKMCSAILGKGQQVAIYAEQSHTDKVLPTQNVHDYFHVNPQLALHLIPSTGNTEKTALNLVLAALEDGCDRIFTRSIDVAIIAAIIDVPVVLELHKELDKSNWFKLDFLVKSPAFEGLVLITQALALKFKGYSKALNKKLIVLPDAADEPAADLPLFPLVANPKAELHVGYVGHLYPGKGAELAVELARVTPNVHFHMLGGLPEDIEKWQTETQLLPNITFYGHCPPAEVPTFIHTVDVAIAPFLRHVGVNGGKHNIADVFSPLKIFEYMALGKAIVCSNLPVIREVLTHNKNAILCSPDNLADWQCAFEALIQDKALKARLEKAAKQDFLQHYTWATRADKVIELIAPSIDLSSGLGQLKVKPIELQPGRTRPVIKWFFGGKKQAGWAYGNNTKRISKLLTNADHVMDGESSPQIPDVALAFDLLIKEDDAFKECIAKANFIRVGGPNPLKVATGHNESRLAEKLADLEGIICLSPQLRDYVSDFHSKVFFIPNGIDLAEYNGGLIPRNDSKTTFTVGFSASVQNEKESAIKGYDYILEACQLTAVDSLVVGRGNTEVAHDRMIADFYSKIDVLVHAVAPGKEASSNVIMEALALGIPVITTRHAGFHGVALQHMHNALIVPRSVDYIAQAIKLLKQDKLLSQKLSKEGRLFAEQHHDITNIANSYARVFGMPEVPSKPDAKALTFTIGKPLLGYGGGAQKSLAEVTSGLAEKGYQVTVLFDQPSVDSDSKPYYPFHPSIRLINIDLFRVKGDTNPWLSAMKLHKQDLVVMWFIVRKAIAHVYDACKALDLPYIASHRMDPKHDILGNCSAKEKALYTQIALDAKLHTVQWNEYQNYLGEINCQHVITIPNAVQAPVRVSNQTDPQSKIILNVGRLHNQKNQRLLIRAFALIGDRLPGWVVHVYGDGPDRQSLETLIAELGLETKVFLKGTSQDMDAVYCSASIFAFPSIFEGFSRAHSEAMSYGLPSIGLASCLGTVSLIRDNKAGVLAENNEIDFANKLLELAETKELRDTLSTNAVATMQQYALPVVINKWQNAIEACLSPTSLKLKKKVVFTIGKFKSYAGGAEKSLAEIASYLADNGFEVVIIIIEPSVSKFQPTYYPVSESVQIDNVFPWLEEQQSETPKNNEAYRVERLAQLFRKHSPDVVYCFTIEKAIANYLAIKDTDIPFVICHRNDPAVKIEQLAKNSKDKNRFNDLLNAAFSHAAIQIVQLEEYKKALPGDAKVTVIPNVVEAVIPNSEEIIKSNRVILNVGRLHPQKNQQLLIRAFGEIHHQHPGWQVHIYGDGPEKENLAALIADLNLEDKVILQGTTQDMEAVYRSASIFAFPSVVEGFSRAHSEAMAYGLPSVALTSCIGSKSLLEGCGAGLLVDNNCADFSANLESLMLRPSLRVTLSQNATEFVSRFTKQKIMKHWESTSYE